jgi:hypothetical protein
MADLATAPVSSCCFTEAQASCCEPSDKASCCDSNAAGGSCGCSAGDKTKALAEAARVPRPGGRVAVEINPTHPARKPGKPRCT